MKKWKMLISAVCISIIIINVAFAETITGTFRYLDSDGILRPIAYARVEIHSTRNWVGIFSKEEINVTTDVNGSISVAIPFIRSGVRYGVKIFAENYAAIVWPNDAVHITAFHREPGQPGTIINRTASYSSDVLDFSFDFTDNWAPQHYNLAETVRHGYDYASARRDPAETDIIPKVNIQPTSISPVGTWYNPTVDALIINSPQVFEDFLILHEYAHFLEEQISSFAWIPSIHDGCTAIGAFGDTINNPEHAWMEGFANYFAQSVSLFLPSGTLRGTPGTGTMSINRLENQPSLCSSLPYSITPDAIENRIAGTLWDLFDQPGDPGTINESHDKIGRQDLVIFQIFDREMDKYGIYPTISHFHDAWVCRGLNHLELDRTFAFHAIPEPSSNACLSPILQTETVLHETDQNWDFEIADWDHDGNLDLIAINRVGGSNTTEVHILSGASNYRDFILHTGTGLHKTDQNWDFEIADWDRDNNLDLIVIKKVGTGTNTTELHILSGASNYRDFILHTETGLHETNPNWQIRMVDWNKDNKLNIFSIALRGTGTKKTEVHILEVK